MDITKANELTKRNSNIELLRIIAMILIVFSHWASHGEYVAEAAPTRLVPQLFIQCVTLFGGIGDVCFVAITGYFLIKSRNRRDKIINVLLWVILYLIVGTVLSSVIFHWSAFSITNVASAFLSVLNPRYWFVMYWILLCTFSPYINGFLLKASNTDRIKVLLTLFIFSNVLQYFGTWGGDFLIFLFWYTIGAEMRIILDEM